LARTNIAETCECRCGNGPPKREEEMATAAIKEAPPSRSSSGAKIASRSPVRFFQVRA
jgi:hypothetical protein